MRILSVFRMYQISIRMDDGKIAISHVPPARRDWVSAVSRENKAQILSELREESDNDYLKSERFCVIDYLLSFAYVHKSQLPDGSQSKIDELHHAYELCGIDVNKAFDMVDDSWWCAVIDKIVREPILEGAALVAAMRDVFPDHRGPKPVAAVDLEAAFA